MKPQTDNAGQLEAHTKELEGIGRALLIGGGMALLLLALLTPHYVAFCKRVIADADAYRVHVLKNAERGCTK